MKALDTFEGDRFRVSLPVANAIIMKYPRAMPTVMGVTVRKQITTFFDEELRRVE